MCGGKWSVAACSGKGTTLVVLTASPANVALAT